MARVDSGIKYGYIDKTGKEVIAPKYDNADLFLFGLAEVGLNGKTGFIDSTGREVIAIKYDSIWCYSFRKEGFLIGAYYSKPDWHSQYFWWDRHSTPNRNVNYDIRKKKHIFAVRR